MFWQKMDSSLLISLVDWNKRIKCLQSHLLLLLHVYSKTCVKRPLSKRPKNGFQDRLSLNAGQKYCRMLHSAILLTFIKLPFVNEIFVLSIFEWPLKTCFTVLLNFSIWFDSMSMGWLIVHIKETQVRISKSCFTSVPEDCFYLSKQCRPWWNALFCSIPSWSSLFA